jgi:hypothetical protein
MPVIINAQVAGSGTAAAVAMLTLSSAGPQGVPVRGRPLGGSMLEKLSVERVETAVNT